MAEKEETLISKSMEILLGFITGSILAQLDELELTEKVPIIIGMGISYGLLYIKKKSSEKGKYKQKKLKVPADSKKPAKGIVSRRVTTILTIGFIIAVVVVGAASLILGLARKEILLLMGFLTLMVVFVLSGSFLSSERMIFFLRAVAAVSLGGALSIGCIPIYEFVTAEEVELTIRNGCPDPIEYNVLDLYIKIPGNDVTTKLLKPVTVTFTRDRDHVYVYAFGWEEPYDVEESTFVSFDGVEIKPGDSRTFDLSEQKHHTLIVECTS
jgi:hypothetical protein